MSHLVYHIIFPNGKAYIGVTCNLRSRLWQHKHRVNTLVAQALAKHGSWMIIILAICDEEYAYALERRAIKIFGTLSPNGYNLVEGGMGGRRVSEKTRLKMSRAHTGKTLSQESRDKISASRLGKKRPAFSQEWRHNLSNSKKGKTYTPSTEHRKAISEAKCGKKLGPMSDHQKQRISEGQRARWARTQATA